MSLCEIIQPMKTVVGLIILYVHIKLTEAVTFQMKLIYVCSKKRKYLMWNFCAM